MKKFLTLGVLAFVLASCGGNSKSLTVDKFYENAIGHVGQEVTAVGQAKICCCSGSLAIINCDGSKKITIIPAEGVAVPECAKDATWEVKGVVSEKVIDEICITTLFEKANAEADPDAKAKLLAQAEAMKSKVDAEGVIRQYIIDATSIALFKSDKVMKCCEDKEGCDKKCCEGEHKEGCDKKCGEGDKEGCEKKCDGHKADKE